ncbi:unnamed protein product [Cuscuta campestris]|uniref:Uncharacterized protein n=1 Tax=Cuscuta campestris TaxID=132261 RepID=A0A484NIC8_9ASTE|nr:unnamed protein product [Cuscuta campestris]
MKPSGSGFSPDDLEPNEHAMWIFQQYRSNPTLFKTQPLAYVYERESVLETQPEPSGTKKCMTEKPQSERHSSDDRAGTGNPKVDVGGRVLVGSEQTKDAM